MVRIRKRIMDVGVSSKNVTANEKYNVHWGSTPKAYNRNVRSFNKRTTAAKFARGLQRKFKKNKNLKTRYTYIAD